MDSGDTILEQESTSRCGESDKVSSRWRQEHSAVAMSTYDSQEGERQANPELIGNPTSVQHYSSLKVGSQHESSQQMPGKQYAQKRPGSYTHRHSLSFPQHTLHQQRLVHSTKPHQSLEGHAYPYHSRLSVASEDLFLRIQGQSAELSRKKFSLASSYSQYSQKSMDMPEDTHKKRAKAQKTREIYMSVLYTGLCQTKCAEKTYKISHRRASLSMCTLWFFI